MINFSYELASYSALLLVLRFPLVMALYLQKTMTSIVDYFKND